MNTPLQKLKAMLKAAIALGSRRAIPIAASVHAAEHEETRRYPEWHSRRKTRGRRDASLRSRSNRRKGNRNA